MASPQRAREDKYFLFGRQDLSLLLLPASVHRMEGGGDHLLLLLGMGRLASGQDTTDWQVLTDRQSTFQTTSRHLLRAGLVLSGWHIVGAQ